MEIVVGKTAGFCYGVKRAVEGAEKVAENEKGKIYGLGEIVHNKEVIEKLSKKGIKFIENINEAKDNVIIRAHGIDKDTYKKAEELKINVVDYTCPNVLKIHEIAEEYSKKGYYIILFGNKFHPENIGTISYCGKNYSVIEEENEINETIENIKKSKIKDVSIISQTTYSTSKFEKYLKILKEKLEKEDVNLVIKNTICNATEIRQKETEELSKKQEYMIIIGGKNSSNTKHLYEIASNYCKNTVCVQTVEELNLEEILKYEKIGIMAGASTPNESIEEIVNKIKENS